jgi:hypothetical protein
MAATATTTTAAQKADVKALEVKDARELAKWYNVPEQLMNLFFVTFNGTLYPKESFLLYLAHRRGVQAVEVEVRKEGEIWEATATIFPRVTSRMLEALSKFPEKERAEKWEYLTKPTVEWGRASKENVRMSTMHSWLKEIAIKRAVARACRLFVGTWATSFEELPEVEITREEARESSIKAKNVTPPFFKNEESQEIEAPQTTLE